MNKQTKVWLVLSIALSLLALAAACGGSKTPDTNTPSSETAAAPYNGPTGSVSGVISYEGTPPAPKKIDTNADPVCGQKNPNLATDDTVVKDGKLANVFVYVSGGLEGKSFAPPADPVTINQEGCRYHPHVLGIMVGQTLKIKNSDATLHNIHATPTKNTAFNVAQSTQGMETEKKFDQEEVMVPVSCDVHGWMRSYIGVLPHPFYGVSGDDGTFTLKGLPPGEYTITAWHEKYGTQKQEIEVKDGQNQLNFTFKAATSAD